MTDNFSPAKRGDYAVIVRARSHYALHTGIRHVTTVEIGTATSITRDGKVKRVELPYARLTRTPRDWDEIHIVVRDRLRDGEAMLEAFASRGDPGSDDYSPLESLNDARQLIREYA